MCIGGAAVDPHRLPRKLYKAAIVAEVEQHLRTLRRLGQNDPTRDDAIEKLNESANAPSYLLSTTSNHLSSLLARVHVESNMVKVAVRKVMNLGVKKQSPAQRDSELAKQSVYGNVTDHGTSLDFIRAPTTQWGMYTASTENLGHGPVYNPVHQPGHFGSTPAAIGAQNPQPSHQYQSQFPRNQQPVTSSSSNWGQYANSRPPSQHSAASSSNHSTPQYDGRASLGAVGGMNQFIQPMEGSIQTRPDGGQTAFDASGRALWRWNANDYWQYTWVRVNDLSVWKAIIMKKPAASPNTIQYGAGSVKLQVFKNQHWFPLREFRQGHQLPASTESGVCPSASKCFFGHVCLLFYHLFTVSAPILSSSPGVSYGHSPTAAVSRKRWHVHRPRCLRMSPCLLYAAEGPGTLDGLSWALTMPSICSRIVGAMQQHLWIFGIVTPSRDDTASSE
ncbi:hypothetical protein C8R43DRAFT_1107436 [Mycena crocata]|nr:hypothetical protein C8R43DRAFT_1107436 [Mycena crocata]